MSDDGPTWRSVVSDLIEAVLQSDRPLTFMIGAGASLSLGAPSTDQVRKAFESASLVDWAGGSSGRGASRG